MPYYLFKCGICGDQREVKSTTPPSRLLCRRCKKWMKRDFTAEGATNTFRPTRGK